MADPWFALTLDGATIADIRRYPQRPPNIPHKGVTWLPFERRSVPHTQPRKEVVDIPGDVAYHEIPARDPMDYTVRKITIIRRLEEMNKLSDYDAAMKDPANVFFARAWEAAGSIKPDDPDVLAFFDAISADQAERDVILAQE